MIRITGEILIGDDEIRERFLRSPGPGGQNVNKVATAAWIGCPPSSRPTGTGYGPSS